MISFVLIKGRFFMFVFNIMCKLFLRMGWVTIWIKKVSWQKMWISIYLHSLLKLLRLVWLFLLWLQFPASINPLSFSLSLSVLLSTACCLLLHAVDSNCISLLSKQETYLCLYVYVLQLWFYGITYRAVHLWKWCHLL